MPELPEVETIVRELRPVVIGKKFWNVEAKLNSVFKPSANDFKELLPGLRVLDVVRKGKYIIFKLSSKLRMIVHLRMTGRLMWHKSDGREKFIRAVFNFSDASSLYFSDVRKFGKLWLYSESDHLTATGMSRLGVEPMEKIFNQSVFSGLFSGRKGILKNTLLRQDIIAGIGNIYADEICFNAGFIPTRNIDSIDQKGLNRIFRAIKFCLGEGIKHCGVSVSDFVGTNGNLEKIQPLRDGVIIRKGRRQATYLPQVWEEITQKETFLSSLCLKAGLPSDQWQKNDLKIQTYQVEMFEEK